MAVPREIALIPCTTLPHPTSTIEEIECFALTLRDLLLLLPRRDAAKAMGHILEMLDHQQLR